MPLLTTDEDAKLLTWAQSLKDEAQMMRRPQEAQWYENVATYMGDFWSEYDLTQAMLVEQSKPDHRVRLPVNLAQPAVRTEYAKLLKNRPITNALARSNERADLNAAKVGDKLLSSYLEKNLAMPKHRRKMLQWVVVCGSGGLFVDYDDKALGEQTVLAGPDGQPVFDERLVAALQEQYRQEGVEPKEIRVPQGELRHVGLSPFQYLYDMSTTDFDNAWWCIVSELYDVDEVFRRWGVEVSSQANSGKPGVIQQRLIQRLDIASTGWGTTQRSSVQKLTEVHRMFVRPGHRNFPDGAEIVFTDGELIRKRKFPYKHGLLPLGVCGHVPMPTSQYSMSVLPQVKPLALEISKTVSQMIENRNLMANPPWVIFRQNNVQGEIQNKPGARINVDWMPNVPEPHPIEMPEIPTYVKDLVPVMKEFILETTGQSEVSQGKVPAGARAGVTIAYLQEEDDTKLGPTVQEYEECIERVAWIQLQTIAEKYDAPRTIRIFRKHSDPEVFDFIGTMLEGVAGVVCQAGSALPRSKAAKQQFILDLWDRGLEQDPRKVREMLELSEGEPDEWEIDIQQAERENRKMLENTAVVALEWHNHAAHHYQHRQFMKSAEFEALDKETQQTFMDHDEEHSIFEADQQRELMVQQMLGGGQATNSPAAGGANGVTQTPGAQFSATETPANVQDYQPQ